MLAKKSGYISIKNKILRVFFSWLISTDAAIQMKNFFLPDRGKLSTNWTILEAQSFQWWPCTQIL